MTDQLIQIVTASDREVRRADRTAAAIDRAEVNAAAQNPRPHFGVSTVGRECPREVWFSWRWASRSQVSPRMARLFERGHDEEPKIVRRLRRIGCTVIAEENGGQIRLRHPTYGGHVSGSCDGQVYGVPDIGDEWAILECKTANTKTSKALAKHGVRKTKPEHWIQMQLYMRWSGLRHALYYSVCKENDETHLEVVPLDDDPQVTQAIEDRIESVLFADQPPDRPAKYTITSPPCSWCDHRTVCWSAQPKPVPTCRTCTRVIVDVEGGAWRCGLRQTALTTFEQYRGCDRREELLTGAW